MPELWETADLLELQFADNAAPPDGFWTGMFPRVFTSQAQTIYFDQLPLRDRRLAPFVAPDVQGRVMRSRASKIASFRPAYVKPKHIVDPTKAIARRPNEPMGGLNPGTMTLDQRYDAAVADNLRAEREMIERRLDWMGCQAVAYGEVRVKGEDYGDVTVGFGRDASLTTSLVGAAQWTDANSSPLKDIRNTRLNARQKGRASLNRFIFGGTAWSAFIEHEDVQKLLDNMKRGTEGTSFDNTGIGDESGAEYMGTIGGPDGGRIQLWTYANDYEDTDEETGALTVRPYLDPRDVIGVGGALGGVQAFGAIMDKKANLQSLKMFPKMWDDDDPPGTYTMTQSAPLLIPTNPNNSARIRAVA